MTQHEKDFWKHQDEYATRFMKGFAATLIVTMVIAGLGLLFLSATGI